VLDLISAKAAESKAKLDPPKPQPEPTPEPQPAPVSVQADPTSASPTVSNTTPTSNTSNTSVGYTPDSGGIGTQASGTPASNPTYDRGFVTEQAYVKPTAPEVAAPSWDPQSSTMGGTTEGSGSGTPQADVGSGGTSNTPSPTQAQAAPTGTGTVSVASSWPPSQPSDVSTPSGQEASQPSPASAEGHSASDPTTNSTSSSGQQITGSVDPEPKKYNEGSTTTVSQAWWDWYDRQSIEYRQNYKFD
jgi:hypothetical protein